MLKARNELQRAVTDASWLLFREISAQPGMQETGTSGVVRHASYHALCAAALELAPPTDLH